MDARVEAQVLAAMRAGIGGERPAAPPGGPLRCDVYADPDRHASELEHAFRRSWIPATRTEHLAQSGDFATFDLAGDRIVLLRGDDAELRVFHNVCRHRGAQILRTSRGRAATLRCPYHGLAYGLDGVLRDSPCPDAFSDRLQPGSTSLAPIAHAEWGGWVWVHLADAPPPMESWLGAEVVDELAEWPLAETTLVAERWIDADFDWKVGVEAFLEPLHVPAIHPRSAHPAVDFRGMAPRALGDHSRMALPFRDPDAFGPDGVLGRAAAEMDVQPFATLNEAQRSAHFVYLLFPSTVLMLFPHHVLFLSFLPAELGRCRIRYELLAAPAETERAEAFRSSLVAGYDRLLEEDVDNLPWIQRGTQDRSLPGVEVSGYEVRIAWFRDALGRRLD